MSTPRLQAEHELQVLALLQEFGDRLSEILHELRTKWYELKSSTAPKPGLSSIEDATDIEDDMAYSAGTASIAADTFFELADNLVETAFRLARSVAQAAKELDDLPERQEFLLGLIHVLPPSQYWQIPMITRDEAIATFIYARAWARNGANGIDS